MARFMGPMLAGLLQMAFDVLMVWLSMTNWKSGNLLAAAIFAVVANRPWTRTKEDK